MPIEKNPNLTAAVSFSVAMAICVLFFHYRLATSLLLGTAVLTSTYAVAVLAAGLLGYRLGRWYVTAPRLWSPELVLLPAAILALAAHAAAVVLAAYMLTSGNYLPGVTRDPSITNLTAAFVLPAWIFVIVTWPAAVPAFLTASVVSCRAHHAAV